MLFKGTRLFENHAHVVPSETSQTLPVGVNSGHQRTQHSAKPFYQNILWGIRILFHDFTDVWQHGSNRDNPPYRLFLTFLVAGDAKAPPVETGLSPFRVRTGGAASFDRLGPGMAGEDHVR